VLPGHAQFVSTRLSDYQSLALSLYFFILGTVEKKRNGLKMENEYHTRLRPLHTLNLSESIFVYG